MGVAATVAPKGLGPQDSTKKSAHWMDLFGQTLSQKTVFGNLSEVLCERIELKNWKPLLGTV